MSITAKLFTDSAACKSRAHCELCRSLTKGRRFRREHGERYQLPDNKVDFDCPYGKEMVVDAEPTEETVEATAMYHPLGFDLPQRQLQPGDALAYIIAQACEVDSVGCNSACPERKAQMNEWGWVRCGTTKLPTIIGWMNEERKARGMKPDAKMARKAVRAAISFVRERR